MTDAASVDGKSEEEVQENVDRAVEGVKYLDFARFEEVKEAFRS